MTGLWLTRCAFWPRHLQNAIAGKIKFTCMRPCVAESSAQVPQPHSLCSIGAEVLALLVCSELNPVAIPSAKLDKGTRDPDHQIVDLSMMLFAAATAAAVLLYTCFLAPLVTTERRMLSTEAPPPCAFSSMYVQVRTEVRDNMRSTRASCCSTKQEQFVSTVLCDQVAAF